MSEIVETEEQEKIYQLYGIDIAIKLLRPGARWEVTNNHFSLWEDPRPQPSWQEVLDTLKKIKSFEDSINTIWTEEQIQTYKKHRKELRDKL